MGLIRKMRVATLVLLMLTSGTVAFAADVVTLPLRMGPVVLYNPLKVTFSSLADPGMKNGKSSLVMTIKDARTGQLEVKFTVDVLTAAMDPNDPEAPAPKTKIFVDISQPVLLTDPYYNAQETLSPGSAATSILTGIFNVKFVQPDA